jgi:sialate O-acetylesterase
MGRLYGDNMILESREAYDIRPFIAGWAKPGEAVKVTFAKHTYPTTADSEGNFEVQMNCCDALTDQVLTIEGESNTLNFKNVACGQIYVCSGQSNMELPLSYVNNGTEEIAAAPFSPNVRLFHIGHQALQNGTARDVISGDWVEAGPTNVGKFSAVCYLTAKKISELYWGDLPFGLIETAWGGTRVEAWAPPSTIETCKGVGPAPAPMPDQQGYSALWNGMVAPLTKFSIRGVLWFQGEHNIVTHTTRERYACTFGAMINAWRDAWTGIGDFPFLYVQLAPYTGYAAPEGDYPHGDISAIRLAQADSLPKIGLDTTGMAVTIDLGDPTAPAGDVHSRLKETVAERLALQAMHVAYAFQEGEVISNYDHPEQTPNNVSLYFSGPIVHAASSSSSPATELRGLEVTLSFQHGEGLYTNDTHGCDIHRGTDGNGGECCAAKDTFQLCTGSLDNTTTLVCVNASSYKLNADGTIAVTGPATINTDGTASAPTSIRHAYANYPQCALYNKAKLPASPFVIAITTGARATIAAPSTGTVAATPPMGLNSWNGFHCNVDERKMRAMADALVTTGLKDAGYSFVNIDDW